MIDIAGTEQPRVTATAPIGEAPAWAVLQRRLFDVLDEAWRLFSARYCEPDGRLRFTAKLAGRDGADDFYEAFFNWPALYMLGGADDLLDACKHHWTGVTSQLTEAGFLINEYERGYDWFHQGESLLFFYGICCADPDDERFRERAHRFARLYLPGGKNYDTRHNIIRAPHNGAGGPRWGLGEEWASYGADLTSMRQYGLPLQFLEGIEEWSDLADPSNAARMGEQMRIRLGRGDVAVNLAATTLVVNSWLYDHDPAAAAWVDQYVSGWAERAAGNDGILPDNVGESGRVGELHDGRWYGGHYGWTWPHGLLSVGSAALIAALNHALITGQDDMLDLARAPVDLVREHTALGVVRQTEMSLQRHWIQQLGPDADCEIQLVPYRRGQHGWFDYGPLPLFLPTWLWWFSMDPADADRLTALRRDSGLDWQAVRPFRDKGESGHEAPWLAYLGGDNPTYPEQALAMALGQVARRIALIKDDDADPSTYDVHWWQRLNPVVTEVLVQLTTGAPQVIYNGGLQHARVRYFDADRGRPGLPRDVAALVERVGPDHTRVQLVNLDVVGSHRVLVQGGAFGEHRIDRVHYDTASGYPGDPSSYAEPDLAVGTMVAEIDGTRVLVDLPAGRRIQLDLQMSIRALTPMHRSVKPVMRTEELRA